MTHFARFTSQHGLALLLALSAPTFAAEPPSPGACRGDMHSLCSSVQPGGGRALACLKQHEGELSPACKTALPTLERCAVELKAVCGDVGRREARSCMHNNADKLSAECRQLAPAR